MASGASKLLVGVNLKVYMDRDQTLSWLEAAVTGLGSINKDDVELFLLPATPLISQCLEKTSSSQLAIGLVRTALNCLLKWVVSTHSLVITKEEHFLVKATM